MNEELTVNVFPGYTPDCKEFVIKECLSKEPIALGTLVEHGREDDSGLAGHIFAIGGTGEGVCGVKVEDGAVLVVLHNPGDWPDIEPQIISMLQRFPEEGDAEEPEVLEETVSGIRIVLDDSELAIRHFICPELMYDGVRKSVASAGMLHDPNEHAPTYLADQLHRISFVRGVLIEGNMVSIVIKDADQWSAAQRYIVLELERSLDGCEAGEGQRNILCPSCSSEERYGFLGTASFSHSCTCEQLRAKQKKRFEHRLQCRSDDFSMHTQRGVLMAGPPERLNQEQREELSQLAKGFLENLKKSEP